jgi:hypothetical protein
MVPEQYTMPLWTTAGETVGVGRGALEDLTIRRSEDIMDWLVQQQIDRRIGGGDRRLIRGVSQRRTLLK